MDTGYQQKYHQCVIRMHICNLHSRFTPDTVFRSICNIFGEVMGIVKFVGLVPLMEQVTWSHIVTCNFLLTSSQ